MYEAEANQVVSIFSDVAKGIPFWIAHLDPVDVDDLLKAAIMAKEIKEKAIRRQQEKLGK
jgi:hypothetical protein